MHTLMLILIQLLGEISLQSNEILILRSDNNILKNYVWNLCVIDDSDTVIVLVSKDMECEMVLRSNELEFTSVVQDEIGYRLYTTNWYLNKVLVFPEKTKVYFWRCPE